MNLIKSFLVLVLLVFSLTAGAAEPMVKHWTISGFDREAIVVAPSADSPQDKHPVIFAFHGHGGNMSGFSKDGALAKRWPEAIVVYPQGLPTPSALDPKGRKPGWQRLATEQGDRDLKFVDAMLTTLHKDYNIDDRRIFATGFSNGAFFSLLLWIERSDVFAGFTVVAGSLEPSERLPTAKPVLQIAGEKDPLVTPEKVKPTVTEERRINGATAEGQDCGKGCTVYHGSRADVKVVWHPGGHVYPPFAIGLSVDFFKSLNQTSTAGAVGAASAEPAGKTLPLATDSGDDEIVFYPSHGVQLKGYVHKPHGNGPFPVYLWNHGSEQMPATGAKLAAFWVPQGVAVFAPIRSGHGGNPGNYIVDEQKKIADQRSARGFRQVVALHERANEDVIAAYQWIAKQPYVDAKRIVVAGGSYGGIQTLLAAERDGRDHLGIKCFVPMSPAAESWGNPNWAGRLTVAVEAARAPIFLMQAHNDYNLGPSEVLGPRIDAKGFPNRHKIFPPHGDPNDHAQGHGGFFSDSAAWSDDILVYMRDCGELK